VTETFEVGQKVRFHSREVEVSYGPFTSPLGFEWLVVRRPDGKEETVRKSDLSAIPGPPKFAVGDKVQHPDEGPGVIAFGPFVAAFDPEAFLVRFEDGRNWVVTPDRLTAVEPAPVKVGDRVRIVRATYAEETHGRVGVVTSTSESWRAEHGDEHPYIVSLGRYGDTVHVAELERIDSPAADTYEYNGVTYDLSAKYRDKDGDVWRFTRFGDRVTGAMGGAPASPEYRTLRSTVDAYGPLTRVND
jgi:hypothetical protein